MKLFPPRHTAESVADELIRGLEDGTITIGDETPAPPPEPDRAIRRDLHRLRLASVVLGIIQSSVFGLIAAFGEGEVEKAAVVGLLVCSFSFTYLFLRLHCVGNRVEKSLRGGLYRGAHSLTSAESAATREEKIAQAHQSPASP